MINLSAILTIILFITISTLSIFGFYAYGRRPAIFHFFVVYIPCQNIFLPLIILLISFSNIVVLPLMSFKDILLLLGLLISLRKINFIVFNLADIIGIVFIIYLIGNSIVSPSDSVSAFMGLRAYSIPVILYFYGRTTVVTEQQLFNLFKLVFKVALIVVVFSLIEYALLRTGLFSFQPLLINYLSYFYGHGAPIANLTTKGFLDYPVMTGPFGNNLILSSYLRLILCLSIFYLSYFRKRLDLYHIVFASLLTISSILTFSRYGIVALVIIYIIILIEKNILSNFHKIILIGLFIGTVIISWGPILKVYKSTINIEDESTYTHFESIIQLKGMYTNFLGHGLGTGVHSKEARYKDKTSEGEGLLRQGIPEIGIIGISLFILFTILALYPLIMGQRIGFMAKFKLDLTFWIALPIIFEVLRIPIDIAIRSFLATGMAWFFIGLFNTHKRNYSTH